MRGYFLFTTALTTQKGKRSGTPVGLIYIAGRRQIKTKHTKSHTLFLSHIINWSATNPVVVSKIILVQVYIIFALPDYSSEVIERHQKLFYGRVSKGLGGNKWKNV